MVKLFRLIIHILNYYNNTPKYKLPDRYWDQRVSLQENKREKVVSQYFYNLRFSMSNMKIFVKQID